MSKNEYQKRLGNFTNDGIIKGHPLKPGWQESLQEKAEEDRPPLPVFSSGIGLLTQLIPSEQNQTPHYYYVLNQGLFLNALCSQLCLVDARFTGERTESPEVAVGCIWWGEELWNWKAVLLPESWLLPSVPVLINIQPYPAIRKMSQ